MKLKIAQVIGLNTDQKAAQVTSSSRDGDNTFFAVLDLASDDAFTKGRQLLSELAEFYFDFEGSPAEKLTATFSEAKNKLAEGQFSFLAASVSGKVLYLQGIGDVEVYLKRADEVSPLLSVGASSQLISGFLQPADKLLLSTKSLVTFLSDDLVKSLNLPLDVFEQDFTDRIGASNLENQGLAGLVVEAEESQEVEQGQEKEEIPSLQKQTDALPVSDFEIRENKILPFVKKILGFFPKSGRSRVFIAVALIVIIALGVGIKIKAAKDAARDASFTQALSQAKDDFSSAKGLSSLNPVDAKAKLDLAKQNLDKALSLKPKDMGAQDLKKQIDKESGSILQQSTLSEFPVFLDMDLVKKNFRAQNLSLSDNKLLLLDPAVKTLVVVDLSKKSNQILAGSETLGDAISASINGGLAFVYSKDKGVLRVDINSQKITAVSKKDKDLEEIKDIYGFAGNVYILESGNPSTGSASSLQASSGQIWKYLPTRDGYSDKREYLTKNTKADLSGSLRMQIESSIYILKSGGEILRFTKGDKDNFGLEGLDKGVKDVKSIFTSSDSDDLYVLDSGNSRLLILTKTGKYKGQIKGEGFGRASDLVVDEKGKKVYLLDGSKIFQVDLK